MRQHPYTWATRLKIGLIVAAVGIAVGSLVYTHRLVLQLEARERADIELWARAVEYQVEALENPFQGEFEQLYAWFARLPRTASIGLDSGRFQRWQEALDYARRQLGARDAEFVVTHIVTANRFQVPALLTDESGRVEFALNVPINPAWSEPRRQAYLQQLRQRMAREHEPIVIRYGNDTLQRAQYIYYGESPTIEALRWFPWVQLLVTALFVLVGYWGFAYVRRAEQSNLWVGMAKETAHQLGTPLMSLQGWLAWLEAQGDPRNAEALKAIREDVTRLERVVRRFSQIGSVPQLRPEPLQPLVERVVAYFRARLPRLGRAVEIRPEVPEGLQALVNAELFEWALENLVRNALDALEGSEGRITIRARAEGRSVILEVTDTGRGIERRYWRAIFRPGFTTKLRGWGLGLSLVRRIIETYHGGAVQVADSRPGFGTTMRIRLPVA
ncbi:MAG: HAMP domain-containing histidine kinase [Bacteroidetes bacterium]|nr:HAMP domain-containing histidine kinase [Rhodothermia bacterium]MCX7907075.1 HAMP domain-containing histidine kinase [Bacteroidota bacterium]MDW8285485.1 HAMP domain-containing sensor histidine kinase [Bacteroidota bacterium]